jgi:hypothetical protein
MNSFNQYFKLRFLIFTVFLSLIINACSDDDPPLPDNLAGFETTTVGLPDNDDEVEIKVTTTRAVDVATDLSIELTPENIAYGTQFTTQPAATANKLTITIPAGGNSASFKVLRSAGVFLQGTEKVNFKLTSVTAPALLGTQTQLALSFSSIVSEGSQLTLNGLIGAETGSAAGNSVFVDFSNNQQTSAARASWDLGFHGGSEFRVIINNTVGASAIAVNKTDINTVTSDDVDSDDLAVGFGGGSFSVVDDIAGSLSKTAIAEISATDSENKVYVVSPAGGSGSADASKFMKIRILRNGTGYTLQYAKISETTFKTINIAKSATHTFKYVSFTTGAEVNVAPETRKWDIVWTWSLYQTGDPATLYAFSDLVFLNYLGGVSAAEVLNTQFTYDAIKAENLTAITFKNERAVIGSNWRVSAPPPTPSGVKTDRFYLIKDADGNVYKLKFISFHASDGGTRGKPVVQYALVKKGS